MAAVEANNQKLFENMAKELSEGAYEVYAHCTNKLAIWLQNKQAYYPAARAQIVRLLLLAQARVRAEVGFKQDLDVPFSVFHYTGHPFVGEYVRLVESMKPFQSFFEGESQNIKDCIRALITTISGPTASDTSKMTSRSLSPSRPAAMDELPQSPVSTAGIVTEYNHVSGNEGIVASPSIVATCVPEGDNIEPQAYIPSSTLPQPHSTISDDTECTRRSLSAIDQISMDDTHFSPVMAKEIQPSPTRDIQETSGVQASAVLRQVRKAKVKRKALEFDVLAKYDEQELLRKKALTAQAQTKLSDNVAEATEVSITTSASDSGAEHERLGKPLQALEQENEVIPSSVGTPIVTDEKLPEKLETEGHKMVDIIHSDSVNKSEKGTSNSLDQQEAVPGLENIHISESNRSSEIELTRGDEASSMDMDDGRTDSPRFYEQTDRDKISAPLSHVLTTIQIQETGPPAEGIFGPEMRVIARQRGLENSFRISIGFEIPEAQFSLVTKWSLRKQIEQSHEKSICITLGCYLVADLQRQSEKEELNTFEKQVSSAQPKWPQLPGSLSLTVVNAEENIPLSPPFHVTPDNLVDISSLLALGNNTLKLRQRQDFRHYMFILHAHHPTRRQLQQLQDHWLKRKEWSRFLDEFSAPLPYESLAGLKGMKLCA